MMNAPIRVVLALGAALFALNDTALAQAPKYQEGIHYTLIPNAPERQGDEIQVAEAFSYMCNHCATFEPYITSWKERMPENVEFTRVPVVFGRSSWELYARAYVTAELMGIADEAHPALMEKLWKEREVMRDMQQLAAFYADFGVEPEAFVATSESFAVDAKMRRDQQMLQNAGVRGTPSLIVDGKYLVAAGAAVGSFDVMLDVVDFLLARESTGAPAAEEAAQGQ